MNWNDDRVELLRKLWQDGLSASQIAAQLGGVSRNAVIGKVHRLKLSARGRATAAPARPKKAAKPAGSGAPKSGGRMTSSRPMAVTVGATALKIHYDAEALPLWESAPTTGSEAEIPSEIRSRLAAGGTFYWRVRIDGESGPRAGPLHRFDVAP